MKVLTPQKDAFDRAVGPLMEVLFPRCAQAVLDFRPEPALQSRIEELSQKARDDELNEAERTEYEGYVLANDFAATLRRQAEKSVNEFAD